MGIGYGHLTMVDIFNEGGWVDSNKHQDGDAYEIRVTEPNIRYE